MNKLKACLATLLCGSLLLGAIGCTEPGDSGTAPPDSSQQGTQGRYVETDITPPGAKNDQLYSFSLPDGTLLCYTGDMTRRFESSDGGDTWQESPGPAALNPDLAHVWEAALLEDGSLLAAVGSLDAGVTELVRIAPDGNTEPFPLPQLEEALAKGQQAYINLLKALPGGRLLLAMNAGNFGSMAAPQTDDNGTPEDPATEPLVSGEGDITGPVSAGPHDATPSGEDPADVPGEGEEECGGFFAMGMGEQSYFAGLLDLADGTVLAEYSEWYGTAAAAGAETLYLMDHTGDVLAKNLADGSDVPDDTLQLATGGFEMNLGLAVGPAGELYALAGSKLQKLVPGAEAETLLEGSAYSFADRGQMLRSLHAPANGDLFLHQDSEAGSRLLRYRWDPDAKLDPEKVLKVWSLKENSILRAAISALRSTDPDIVVEYEVALQEGTGLTAEDAIKNLNTRLLNGDGPDVMLLDGCPAESYAGKGMLLDLAGMLDTGDMFPSIRQPFEGAGGTFYLPMSFRLPLLVGTGDNLAGTQTLADLAALALAGNGPAAPNTEGDPFAGLPEAERPVLAPSDLREVFDLLWHASAASVLQGGSWNSDSAREMLAALQALSDKYGLAEEEGSHQSGAIAIMSAGGASATLSGSALAYATQTAMLGGYLADDLQMLRFVAEVPGSQFTAFPGLAAGSFIPETIAAISADSQKTALATQLLQTMLDVQVQGSRTGSGLPVTAAGMEKQIADLDELHTLREDTQPVELDVEQLLAQARQPYLADDTLTEMVWAVAEGLCNGEHDLEGAVKQLELDLRNYLAERQ